MSGELFGYVMDKLMEHALDVTFTPIIMKKGRPAIQICVICPPDNERAVAECLFRETTTLGVRIARMERTVLKRHSETLETDFGPIRVKIAEGHASPEFEDCKKAALEHNVPLRDVYSSVTAAVRASNFDK